MVLKKVLIEYMFDTSHDNEFRVNNLLRKIYKKVGRKFRPISNDEFEIFNGLLKEMKNKGDMYVLSLSDFNFSKRYLYLFLSLCNDEQINKLVRNPDLPLSVVRDIIQSRRVLVVDGNEPFINSIYGLSLLHLVNCEDRPEVEEIIIQKASECLVDVQKNDRGLTYLGSKYEGNERFLKRLLALIEMKKDSKEGKSIPFLLSDGIFFRNKSSKFPNMYLGKFTPKENDFTHILESLENNCFVELPNLRESYKVPFQNYTNKYETLSKYYENELSKEQSEKVDTFIQQQVIPFGFILREAHKRFTTNSKSKDSSLMFFDLLSFYNSFFSSKETMEGKFKMVTPIFQESLSSTLIKRITGVDGKEDMLINILEGKRYPILLEEIPSLVFKKYRYNKIPKETLLTLFKEYPSMLFNSIDKNMSTFLSLPDNLSTPSASRKDILDVLSTLDFTDKRYKIQFKMLIPYLPEISEELAQELEKNDTIIYSYPYVYEKERVYGKAFNEENFPEKIASILKFKKLVSIN